MTTNKLPQIGEIFDQRYKLLEYLGSGGFGTLFKALQTDSGRLIALKVLPPHIAVEKEFRERFFREAQALSKLQHENIVTVYHLGLTDIGLPYLAMELVNGLSLRRILLETGSLNEERTLLIMLQVCRALTCMHEAGIIHRDLKPDNIMLSQKPEPDTVKIIDFGLAKTFSDGDQKLTSTGVVLGSVNYMSPEQCQGAIADARSDIYSAAICMYEMLAGEPPFLAESAIGVMYKHANEQPKQLHLSASSSMADAINKLISKGLEKQPNTRFQSAAEMHDCLLEITEQAPQKFSRSEAHTFSKSFKRFKPALAAFAAMSTVMILFLAAQKPPAQKSNGAEFIDLKKAKGTPCVSPPSGNTAKTELMLKRRVTEEERVSGSSHPNLGTSLLQLGTYYLEERRWELAEEALKRALAIPGQNANDTVAVLEGLGICSMEKRRFVEAEPYFKSAIKLSEKKYGSKDARMAKSLVYLAIDYSRQDKYADAEPLLKEAVSINEKLYEPYSPEVSRPKMLLADCLMCNSKYEEAEPILSRLLIITENEFGTNSPILSNQIKLLAQCYKKQGKTEELKQLLKQAQSTKENPNKTRTP